MKIRPASALIWAFVQVNVSLLLIAVKRFRTANATDIALELAHLFIHAPLIINEIVLWLELERERVSRDLADFLVHRSQALVQFGPSFEGVPADIAARCVRVSKCEHLYVTYVARSALRRVRRAGCAAAGGDGLRWNGGVDTIATTNASGIGAVVVSTRIGSSGRHRAGEHSVGRGRADGRRDGIRHRHGHRHRHYMLLLLWKV